MPPVLVIDFGSQVTQLIVRRVRESGVYCEVVPFNKADAALERETPRAIILSGGPASVGDSGSPRAPERVFKLGVPVFGICYGQQAMVAQLGGRVEPHHKREFGRAEIEVSGQSPLLEGVWPLGSRDVVWMSHGAVGDQLTCIFVDTGLMRAREAEEVVSLFRGHYNIPLIHTDASELFLSRLEGVSDPEKKRKIIGAAFIDVFDGEAKKIGNAEFLAQGTLYPDVIESVSALGGPSVTIKSHHNVGGLPERMHLKLVEPLRDLFKDEVRVLARELRLPRSFVGRHPFPGPGPAIRSPRAIATA